MQAQAKESEKKMLVRRVREVESEISALEQEVTMVRSQLCLKNCEGDELRSELADLKNRMTVRSTLIQPNSFTMVVMHR